MTNSLLEIVADHEAALMRELAATRSEAQRLLEEAHAAAAAHLQSVQQELDAEIAERRRDAAHARSRIREEIQADTERRVAAIRSSAADSIGPVQDEIVQMLLPGARPA